MNNFLKIAGVAVVLGAIGVAANFAIASDHADTVEVVANPATDLSDVFIFPSEENSDNVVFAMMVRPLIPAGQSASARFDPNVLYQFKLDLNEDGIEDRVIQVAFEGDGQDQTVKIAGPFAPASTGTTNVAANFNGTTGTTGTPFNLPNGIRIFAGPREDPFFFDLEQFFTILPDRGVPSGLTQPPANPNQPMATTWRAPGQAVDFLSNGGFNVLAIVVEVPRSMVIN